jgi:tRNA U34 5-methylaminomethyl-2-thiouridine-forming methyltransferase MnmC
MDRPASAPESPRPVETGDGSRTLHHPGVGETYHSTRGAATETRHVFLDAGLDEAARIFPAGPLRVLEVGFGTGLVALMAAERARNLGRALDYTGYEPFPVPPAALADWPWPVDASVAAALLPRLHALPGEDGRPWSPAPDWRLRVHRAALPDAPPPDAPAHVVFHDAFSPDRDPAPWRPEVLEWLFQNLEPGGLWVSYCAKGAVRRALRDAGFTVERLPGPPGKREMLRARKPGGIPVTAGPSA